MATAYTTFFFKLDFKKYKMATHRHHVLNKCQLLQTFALSGYLVVVVVIAYTSFTNLQ